MSKYEDLYNHLKAAKGWDDNKMARAIKAAQLWHNPLNFDDGESLKEEKGWNILFTEALEEEGYGHRYYFRFHDYDCTDSDIVFNNFKDCRNWDRYVKVWVKYAPKGLRNEAIYLLAMTEMTQRGFIHEKKVADDYRDAGHEVVLSTPEEDLRGIDIIVDGKPIQIKSPATAARM